MRSVDDVKFSASSRRVVSEAVRVREGEARGTCVRCDDGPWVAVASASVRDAARVVVLGAPALTSPFRDATDRGCVMLPYTRDEWVRCLDAIGSTAQSFALAVMLLPSAPLLAAPLLGMLSPLPASP